MPIRPILQLGDPRLHQHCELVREAEAAAIREVVADLHDTMLDFRARYQAGRAIAAPQIGVMKRLVYMQIDRPVVFINPVLDQLSSAMMELWDDCMCFPELLVRLRRHRSCRITFRDLEWQPQQMLLEGALSELLQHEYDHLDGVLATSRALDARSFALRSQRHLLTVASA